MSERSSRHPDHYRTRLLDAKQQLEADLEVLARGERELEGGPNEPGSGGHWEHSGYGDHLADGATELFEREKNIGLEQTLRRHLSQVEHAFAKIEDGTYGQCESCGRPITPERLDALPEATLCIQCKAQDERAEPGAQRYGPDVSN